MREIARHSSGSTLALKYAKKIDFLSPVWFDFRIKALSKNSLNFYIEGDHNVDKAYIAQIKQKNPDIEIYPRVHIDTSIYENFFQLVNTEEPSTIAEKFVETFKKYDQEFDGIVLDSPLFSFANQLQFDFLEIVQLIIHNFGQINKNVIISLLGGQENRPLSPPLVEKLALMSYKLLICTYDYASSKPGEHPIAPYKWIQQHIDMVFEDTNLATKVVERKIMMGIPFYGQKIDYQNGKMEAIINNQYIDILKAQRPEIIWDNQNKECVVKYVDRTTNNPFHISYPCLKFIQSRLRLVEEYRVGAFIWEGGQGLEYFYELL